MTKKQKYVNEKIEYYRTLLPLDKYNHPGVYSITINNEIVYVGKARDMATRIATHMYLIKGGPLDTDGKKFKYGEMKRALEKNYQICFDVLYTSSFSCSSDTKDIDDDIGPQEAIYINKFLPKLNKQIPDLENYHKYKNKAYQKLNI